MSDAKIHSIVYQPEDQEYGERYDDFIRIPVESINLIANHGIEGDRKAGHAPKRQLNLLDHDWVQKQKEKGFNAIPGAFGEQVVIQGLDVLTLNRGDQLQLGDFALIEITMPRTGCSRLEMAHGDMGKPEDPIGMMARVLETGKISVGDPIQIMSRVSIKQSHARN